MSREVPPRPSSRFRIVLVVAFGVACGTPAPSGDAGDAGGLDAASDAGDATLDASTDAGVDASGPRCMDGVAAPAWVANEDAPHRFRVDCGARQLSLWSLADGVVRVRYLAPGDAAPDRSFALVTAASELAGAPIEAVSLDDGETAGFCTPELSIRVRRDGCLVEARDIEGRLLVDDAGGDARSVVRRSADGEPFYGLGEKTGALDRRGRRYVFWNTDAYDPAYGGWAPDQDPLYLSVPFFIALRAGAAYGVFTDSAHRVEIDLGASDPALHRVATEGPRIDQYLVTGPRIADVVRRFTALTGRTPLPPRWALGFHQSRWGYSPASRLDDLAREFRDRAIPLDALWLDIQHMDAFRTFTFDPATFPDPNGLAARLAADGLHLATIEDPCLKVDPGWTVYDAMLPYALRDASGVPFEGNAWPGRCVFPDFTHPDARAIWGEQVKLLAGRGVTGVWLDVNEPTVFPESGGAAEIPSALVVEGDGIATTLAEAHNVYALHEARATFEGLRAAHPDRRPFILSRAGYAGIQRYAAIWTGDAPSTWETLRQTPAMLASLGLSGVPFVGSDIGGYSGGPSAELFARWMELGAYSPFCRDHVTNGVADQEPWAFGSEVEDISRHRLRERSRLLPYLYSLFAEAALTGAPVLRPLVYEFQEQEALHRVGDELMIGPFLLIAPVLEPGATTRRVQLPAGRWTELESGAIHDGPATVDVSITLAATPTFVREGAILPRGDARDRAGAPPTGPLRLDVYPSASETEFVLYDDAGDGYGASATTRFTLVATASGARLTVAREGAYPIARALDLFAHGVDHDPSEVRVDGAPLVRRSAAELDLGGFLYDAEERAIAVVLPDRPSVIELDYDSTITELRPGVLVTFEVSVPAGTPLDPPPHVVTSTDAWSTQWPLTWVGTGVARGSVRLPRGEWFFYKYTRGGWTTVETWAGCVEASDRYGFASANPVRRDSVATWRDWCPP
jgi:alpha-glucosidase